MSVFKRFLVLAFLSAPAVAQQPFQVFGARALAMGGAGVALDDGASSVLDNPANVPPGGVKSAATLGGFGIESGDVLDNLSELSGRDPAALAQSAAQALAAADRLRTLATPGNGILGSGQRLGAIAMSRGIAVSVTRPAWTGAYVRADLAHVSAGADPATSIRDNGSVVAFRGLSLTDYCVSGATDVVKGLRVGTSLHLLKGTTYSKEESVFTTEVDDPFPMARRGLTGDERSRTRFSWDVGALLTFGPVRLGGVYKAINRPQFPFADGSADAGSAITLGRQARVGAAVHIPVIGITAIGDLDLTKNQTLVPGLESRLLSGGAEGRLGIFSLRGGASVNLASSDREKTFSAGFGFSAGVVRIDGAAVFQSTQGLGGMVTVRAGL